MWSHVLHLCVGVHAGGADEREHGVGEAADVEEGQVTH